MISSSAFFNSSVYARGNKDPRVGSSKKREPKRNPMSDQDILDPRKLNLNVYWCEPTIVAQGSEAIFGSSIGTE